MPVSSDDVIEGEIRALEAGRAFARLAGRRIVRVSDADAVGWLQDLLTADVASLPPGHGCRSLLLSPTGRLRADVWLLRGHDEVIVLQDPDAGDAIDEALAPYALSSEVTLERIDDRYEPMVVPARPTRPDVFVPSIVGTGADLLIRRGDQARRLVGELLDRGLVEVSAEALERRRVRRGVPRMGRDFDRSCSPAEAGLEGAISFSKGCFLGQESVARVRNLGHPRTVLVHVGSTASLRAGDEVCGPDGAIGAVTSAAPSEHGSIGLVRVPWAAADGPLVTADGHLLHRLPPSG